MIHCENCRFWVYGYCLGLRRETYDRDGCEAGEKKIIRSTRNEISFNINTTEMG